MGGGWGRGRSGKFLAHCDKEVELLVMRSRMNMSKIPREGLDRTATRWVLFVDMFWISNLGFNYSLLSVCEVEA